MAQIREFESTTESYFILDGVSYPKVYEAMLDNGYSETKIKLVGTNRDTTQLVFSTEYTNIRVDDASFGSADEAISRLNQVVFSKGGGSGDGGTDYIPTLQEVLNEGNDPGNLDINIGNPFGSKFAIKNYSEFYDVQTSFGLQTGAPGSFYLRADKLNPYKNIFYSSLNLQGTKLYELYFLADDNSNNRLGFSINGNDEVSSEVAGMTIIDDIHNVGLSGRAYFGNNAVDNTYIQKKYVDDLMDARIPEPPASGTFTLQSVDGVLTWI